MNMNTTPATDAAVAAVAEALAFAATQTDSWVAKAAAQLYHHAADAAFNLLREEEDHATAAAAARAIAIAIVEDWVVLACGVPLNQASWAAEEAAAYDSYAYQG